MAHKTLKILKYWAAVSPKNQFSWRSFWDKRILLKYGSRSGLDLIEEKLGLNAKIIPSCGKLDASNYCSRLVNDFASDLSAGFVEADVYYNGTSTPLYVFSSSAADNPANYLLCNISAGKPRLNVRISGGFSNVYIANTALTIGWHTLKWESAGGAYHLYDNGVEVAGTSSAGSNDGKFFADATNRKNISIGINLVSTPGTSQEHYVSRVNVNNQYIWYVNGAGKYEYDVVGGMHMTWTGTAHIYYSITIPSAAFQMLNVGYSLYEKTGEVDEYVPYASTNTPCDAAAFLTGYTKIGDKPGGTTFHNLAYSLIDFDYTDSADANLANFDRSNTTIYADAARTGHAYDAANTYRFIAKDIFDPRIYFDWRNVNYKGKYFAKIEISTLNITKMTELYLMTEDFKGGREYQAMQETGIDDFVIIEDGTYTVDENNYVVIIS